MLRPAISQILKANESYYALVIAVAKRARDIVEEAEEQKEELIIKPVKIAVDEFAKNKCKMTEEE